MATLHVDCCGPGGAMLNLKQDAFFALMAANPFEPCLSGASGPAAGPAADRRCTLKRRSLSLRVTVLNGVPPICKAK